VAKTCDGKLARTGCCFTTTTNVLRPAFRHLSRPKIGLIPCHSDLTLFAAIQSARGATEFGALNRVKLIRGKEAKVYDLRKDENKTLKLEAGDVIEVPQKNFIGK